MLVALKAGTVYFALVFAAGFALGAARVLFVAPSLGELVAVLCELPVMLAISWFACGWVMRRERLPHAAAHRAAMGASAFAQLMIAEALVSAQIADRDLAGHLARYRTPPAALGLMAQMAFALFPLFQQKGWPEGPD